MWELNLGLLTATQAPVLLAGGTLLLCAGTDTLFAVDASNGAMRWNYTMPIVNHSTQSPAVDAAGVLYVSQYEWLTALVDMRKETH